ncbi:AAA family ATPase [Chryseobacterium vrystaatense]|uniref:AAA domain-containing protein, putative AbiEii toxin, Type IV TA system n=1 Tax=Chryseobacterium vrystaatense TaxID=307480 RepID=A0A1M4YXA5_9FLAO|nr:AAA family ATPase [Chryseobacterium vrystaatense]SHF10152.1 AAA domain-containing protein, putative AbiEii toxin, Type IV TA system [Chryseobacterium vrystaatense]
MEEDETINELTFYLSGNNFNEVEKKNIIVLTRSSWDDMFSFSTLYSVIYYNSDGERTRLGAVKIGQVNMKSDQRSPNLPSSFTSLDDNFFSLGQDVSYYEELNEISDAFRENFLNSLNDLAYNNEMYKKAYNERVTRISLMRDISHVSVIGQFRRLAQGTSVLTTYDFDFILPNGTKLQNSESSLHFSVVPKSNPPTNIHVVIGRNGVGKTFLFNNMIMSLLYPNSSKYGYFKTSSRIKSDFFANLISVSFSAFEEATPIDEMNKGNISQVSYSYIGLKTEREGKVIIKSPTILKNEFARSSYKCLITGKKQRWLRAVKVLETDPIFKDSEISEIANFKGGFEDFRKYAANIFVNLSSGHKIILLTITRLVETIEEKSLVIIDEPETYLHPPLLSAFIRSLSDLLIQRNGVAIIGTHSPVVLQEVPKSCVWKLRRIANESIVERLDVESFGENVGVLTQEVFGLEVTDAGFHNILKEIVERADDYNEAITYLNNQLGFEGKAILRNLLFEYNEEN